jgi:hypothetical protein
LIASAPVVYDLTDRILSRLLLEASNALQATDVSLSVVVREAADHSGGFFDVRRCFVLPTARTACDKHTDNRKGGADHLTIRNAQAT